MRLLLTNDDGIAAPGLEALEAVARQLQLGEVLVVAPMEVCSGCGHRVTTASPIHVEEHGPGRFAVDGTPADCVRLALHGLIGPVDVVLSGINAGGNLGADVFHSGTVAAVREALLHGVPGIALSHYKRRERDFHWQRAGQWLIPLLHQLIQHPLPTNLFWNVNLPHLGLEEADPEVAFCPVDFSPLPLSFRREGKAFVYDGNYHTRTRQPGSDIDHCFSGRIAVSEVRFSH